MKEFYEPMLYMSTPEHPNTMAIQITLKEPVDGEILQSVVEELRVRFPYFYIKVTAKDNDLFPIPNSLPMTVRNTWDPIDLNSAASNFHFAAWKYDGKRLAFEISHTLTDVACEITCINHQFFLTIGQTFSSEDFISVFLDELASVGIDYEIIQKEPLRLCGLEKFSQTWEESNPDEKTM